MAKPTTIATRLFILVFGGSVAWFTFSMGFQVFFEYRNTRNEADRNLEALYSATRSGLENALWNYDTLLIQRSLEATRGLEGLSGAMVRDEKGNILASWGEPPSALLEGPLVSTVEMWNQPLIHRFVLSHGPDAPGGAVLGELFLIIDMRFIENRTTQGLGLILANYLATTLVLFVLLLGGLNLQVSQPLKRITRSIAGYRFDQSNLAPPDPQLGSRSSELNVLWRSFESLTQVLKESYLHQRVMSAILEEAAVMALVCDGDGRVLSSNAQARVRLAGSQPGGDLRRLAYGEDATPLLEGVPELLASGKSWRGEVTTQSDQGKTYWLSAALLPLAVPDEPRARWGVMIEDISNQKLTERYRLERDLAQEATRAKSLFLANISHEIRTPMNAVVGLTALALGEEVSPRARSYLSQLQRSGSALLGVINDILDFSKLEEGKLELESVDFELTSLLDAVDAIARFRAEEKGLHFSIVVDPDIPSILRGDRLRLQQVLVNLVANALKFTEEGQVRVAVRHGSAAPSGGRVGLRFEVEDSGIGIAREDQGRLFQSFSQVDASTTRVYGGTGLGLAICQQLVLLMEGTLGLESEKGKGSLFWFDVVLHVGQAAAEAEETLRSLAGLRVLLAEDNKVNQLVAREILARVGIHPVVVANGVEAIERVEAEDFDVVLMDLQMPVMDGLEATRAIRRTRSADELPILAMTAHTFAQELETCLAAGMQDLIPKPVDPDGLYRTLSRWLPGASRPARGARRAPGGSA